MCSSDVHKPPSEAAGGLKVITAFLYAPSSLRLTPPMSLEAITEMWEDVISSALVFSPHAPQMSVCTALPSAPSHTIFPLFQ